MLGERGLIDQTSKAASTPATERLRKALGDLIDPNPEPPPAVEAEPTPGTTTPAPPPSAPAAPVRRTPDPPSRLEQIDAVIAKAQANGHDPAVIERLQQQRARRRAPYLLDRVIAADLQSRDAINDVRGAGD